MKGSPVGEGRESCGQETSHKRHTRGNPVCRYETSQETSQGEMMNCLWCEKEIHISERGRPRKYCSHACRQRAYESRKYRMDEVWIAMRQYDNCYLCAEALDWSDEKSICLDHMLATVHGGRTHPPNLRPVHVLCNLRKGAALIQPA